MPSVNETNAQLIIYDIDMLITFASLFFPDVLSGNYSIVLLCEYSKIKVAFITYYDFLGTIFPIQSM
jgi:hypothetical protein